MPDVDGFELIDLLKGDFRTSHIPVVVTSALSEVQHRINALKKGASAFLPKPFNLKETRLQIDNLLKLQGEIEKERRTQWLEYKSELTRTDQEFIENLNDIIEENLSLEHFGVETLSHELGVSRVQLHRKISAVCGCSASNYIKRYKLAHAAKWLREKTLSISEIGYKLGYSSIAHFSRSFKNEYKISPKEFREKADK